MLTGEGDDRLDAAVALAQVVADRVEVLEGSLDRARHDHRPGLTPDLARAQHLVVEVIDHDLRLDADGVIVALDVGAELARSLPRVEHRVFIDLADQLVVAGDGRVVGEDIDDEPLLDRLLHRVAVERAVLSFAVA